jgi:hypothetical protein
MKTIHSNKKVYLQNQDTTLRIQPKVSTKSHVIKHTLRIQPKVSTKSHVIKLTLRIQSKVSTKSHMIKLTLRIQPKVSTKSHVIYINMVKPVKRTQHKKLNKFPKQLSIRSKKSIATTMNDLTHFQTFCIIKHKATNTDQPVTTKRPPQPAYIVKHASAISSSLRRNSPTTIPTIL